jgi:hypothetical protein
MSQTYRPDTLDQLAEKPGEWASFFSLLDTLEIPADFMSDREALLPDDRGGH